MNGLSLNIQNTLGVSAPLLQNGMGGVSPLASAVSHALQNPASSTFIQTSRTFGARNVHAWLMNNQHGSAIVVPDRLGPSRDIFRHLPPQQLPENMLRQHMDAFLMRLLWFDRGSWDALDVGSPDVAGVYSTVHYMSAVRDIVPPLYTHVVENPGALNVFGDTAREVCDDLEAEMSRYEIASVVERAVPTAKVVRPDGGGALRVKIIEGESLGLPIAALGDAYVDFRYIQRSTTRYGGVHRKEKGEDFDIIRSAAYLQERLTWKKAFSIFCIEDEEFIFMTVPKDGETNSSHAALRHGLRVLLGAEDIGEMIKYQGAYGYIEYGIQDNESKVVVVLNSLCGTRIYDGCISDRLTKDASEVMRVFGSLSTPELPVEVVFSKDREKPQRIFGPR